MEPKVPAYLGMGELYLEWGHLADAQEAYEDALALEPQSAAAYLGLGDVRRDQGQDKEALAAYEKARELAQDDEVAATIHANLADIYNTSGRLDEALASYREAVRLRPDDALSYGSLAGLYRKMGRREAFEEAIAEARELMAEENEYNRACLEAIAEEAERAVDLLQVALQKRQVDPGWVRKDPDFDFIRDHPRFQTLLHNWLPDEPEAPGDARPVA